MRTILRLLGLLVILALAGALYVFLADDPILQIPGRALSGTLSSTPIDDWTFINDLGICQVEVNPDAPHSINAFCFESQKELYVGCMRCPGKTWSALIQDDPRARIRFGQNIYPVTATRIMDEEQRDRVWANRYAKRSDGEPPPTPDDWWLFHLVSR